MSFVRVKRISRGEYAYLVTNSWTGKGARQKVASYLGRVMRPERAKNEGLGAFLGLADEKAIAGWISKSSFREIAEALIRLELSNYNASCKLDAEKRELLHGKSKPVVAALNDGFLCSYTAKKLLEYDAAADYSGYNLADALTAAGIAAEKGVFIMLFAKAQATGGKGREDEEKKLFKDFYY